MKKMCYNNIVMDALIIDLLIIIAYSLFILIVSIVRARNGARVARFIFLHASVMYFCCLVISCFLPTQLSETQNLFLPFEGLVSAIKSGIALNVVNYLSHEALNVIIFVPFGIFVSVTCILRADSVFFSKVALAGVFTILIIEVIQSFLPFRSFETDDFIFEMIGVIIGYAIIRINQDKKKVREFLSKLL